MAQVTLRINGYAYILGCADGEEDHLRALAADLDRRIDDIKTAAGPSGESRLLLMAALVLSDELHDLRERTGASADPAKPADRAEARTGRRLRGLAKRAEAIAEQAESQTANGADHSPAPDAPPEGESKTGTGEG
jgi:cell division protein ZapA